MGWAASRRGPSLPVYVENKLVPQLPRLAEAEAGLRLAEAGAAPRVGHSWASALPKLSQVPASPASVVGLQLVEGMLEGESPHKFTPPHR